MSVKLVKSITHSVDISNDRTFSIIVEINSYPLSSTNETVLRAWFCLKRKEEVFLQYYKLPIVNSAYAKYLKQNLNLRVNLLIEDLKFKEHLIITRNFDSNEWMVDISKNEEGVVQVYMRVEETNFYCTYGDLMKILNLIEESFNH